MEKMLLSQDLVKKLVGNTIFSVQFTKKDGTNRKMLCRLGVKKHLKGGLKKYDLNHLLTVFDVLKGEYRTINLLTVSNLKFKGNNINL